MNRESEKRHAKTREASMKSEKCILQATIKKKKFSYSGCLNQGSPLHRELPRLRKEQDLKGDATFVCTLKAVGAGDNNQFEKVKVTTYL